MMRFYALFGLIGVAFFSMLIVGGCASSQNMLPNPDFSLQGQGWVFLQEEGQGIGQWQVDEGGEGSLHIALVNDNWTKCYWRPEERIPVEPESEYFLAGYISVENVPEAWSHVFVRLEAYQFDAQHRFLGYDVGYAYTGNLRGTVPESLNAVRFTTHPEARWVEVRLWIQAGQARNAKVWLHSAYFGRYSEDWDPALQAKPNLNLVPGQSIDLAALVRSATQHNIRDVAVDLSGLRLRTSGFDASLEFVADLPQFANPLVMMRQFRWFTVEMSVDKGSVAGLKWYAPATGWMDGVSRRIDFPVVADGKMRRYTIDLFTVPFGMELVGRVESVEKFGFIPSDEGDATVVIKSIGFGATPLGAGQLAVNGYRTRPAVVRASEDVVFEVDILNQGAEATPPTVIRIGDDEFVVPQLGPGEIHTLSFTKRFTDVQLCTLPVQISDAVVDEIVFRVQPALPADLPQGYVPEPNPVEADYWVGVYYFPGWSTAYRWTSYGAGMVSALNTPLVGHYLEGDPVLADWQIKYAVEAGISCFIFDWYWTEGAPDRELSAHLHDGFLQARYRDYIDFCLLWCPAPAEFAPRSKDDVLSMTEYWLDNYFQLPQYLVIDNKPVVFVFSPGDAARALGGWAQMKEVVAEMNALAKRYGFDGIYLIGNTPADLNTVTLMADAGFSCTSAYHYSGAGSDGAQWAPYRAMVEGHEPIWREMASYAILPYIPTVTNGWDSRAWHGPPARVRTGKSPEGFKTLLLSARRFLEESHPFVKPMVVVEAWNEWGEGSVIEPSVEWGFEFLNAIREVFAPGSEERPPVLPEDVGAYVSVIK